MYSGAKNKVRANGSYSDEFEVKLGVPLRLSFKPIVFHYSFGSII